MAKVKIPKNVGGVKIPKKVRKKAKKALKLAESPVVREFAAAAVGAAAKANADRMAAKVAAGNGSALHASVRLDGVKVGDVLRTAALDGLRRFLEGFDEGLRNAAADPRKERPARKPSRPPAPEAE